MLEKLENFLKSLNVKYEKEKDNLYYYRYLFEYDGEEVEILFANNHTIYMSAGYYNQRILCSDNDKLESSLDRLKKLMEKRKEYVSNHW